MRGMRHGSYCHGTVGTAMGQLQPWVSCKEPAGGGGRGMEDVKAGRNAGESGRGREGRGDRDTARGTGRDEAATGLQLHQRERES